MLYDKEFFSKEEADQYAQQIDAEYGYEAVVRFEVESKLWVVEVWKNFEM